MAPLTPVLRRLPDTRAHHYWDKNHVLAGRMKKDARPPQPAPNCCEADGILWDLAAVYPKNVRWEATMPPAVVFDGPVTHITKEIEDAIGK